MQHIKISERVCLPLWCLFVKLLKSEQIESYSKSYSISSYCQMIVNLNQLQ